MTDKLYLITEAQRDAIVAAFSTLTVTMNNEPYTDKIIGKLQNHAEIKKQLEVLQSLPMVDSGSLTGTYIQTVPDECDRIVWRSHYYHLPLKDTSPQTLTPITADDVTDACVQELWSIGRLTHLWHIGKNDVAACINAHIKHKGDTK